MELAPDGLGSLPRGTPLGLQLAPHGFQLVDDPVKAEVDRLQLLQHETQELARILSHGTEYYCRGLSGCAGDRPGRSFRLKTAAVTTASATTAPVLPAAEKRLSTTYSRERNSAQRRP